jgi:hypothetical protein
MPDTMYRSLWLPELLNHILEQKHIGIVDIFLFILRQEQICHKLVNPLDSITNYPLKSILIDQLLGTNKPFLGCGFLIENALHKQFHLFNIFSLRLGGYGGGCGIHILYIDMLVNHLLTVSVTAHLQRYVENSRFLAVDANTEYRAVNMGDDHS